MVRFFVMSALICFAALLAAQEQPSSVTKKAAASVVKVTDEDNGKTIQLSEKATLVVKLSSNQSTGYGWSVKSTPAFLKLLKSDYSEQKRPAPLAGAPGVQTFLWQVKKAGIAKLQLEYRRPWEKAQPAAKTFSVTVEVQ